MPPKSHTGFARGDDAAPALVVGAGGVGPAADDGEVDPLVALGEEPAPDVARHLGLGATDERDVAAHELGGDAIGGRRGPAEGGDLVGVLHRPQRGR